MNIISPKNEGNVPIKKGGSSPPCDLFMNREITSQEYTHNGSMGLVRIYYLHEWWRFLLGNVGKYAIHVWIMYGICKA